MTNLSWAHAASSAACSPTPSLQPLYQLGIFRDGVGRRGSSQFRLIYENYEDKGSAGDWEELKEVEEELSSIDLESKSKTRKATKSQLRRKLGACVQRSPPPPLPAMRHPCPGR